MTIEIRELEKTFPDGTRGLDGVDLVLDRPGFTVLTGPNGSGKSLLARHILGLERPDRGTLTLDGRPVAKILPETRRRVALVFQEPEHQILGLTVREDLEFGPRSAGVPKSMMATLVDKALEAAGLRGLEDRLTAALSGGEKRRLALASALTASPELVILDEPFNDLDWQGASDLLAAILGLGRSGVGILVVTHDLEKCLAHADRLVVMNRGKVVLDGLPASLWHRLPEHGLRVPGTGPHAIRHMTWLKDSA
ncbi:MAG TPA: ABC transporter ATP-binding protein [Spirochaetales bacterium]|nr:ABC transporter ATP-binding protein [Spirochaetales bacterium]MBP7263113.1 ABC transporter ATP-binding protein [Spirochaetia bacterium]HPE36369.1 ABC transporter ATP-binding protein [Spirochaetales bacterium]